MSFVRSMALDNAAMKTGPCWFQASLSGSNRVAKSSLSPSSTGVTAATAAGSPIMGAAKPAPGSTLPIPPPPTSGAPCIAGSFTAGSFGKDRMFSSSNPARARLALSADFLTSSAIFSELDPVSFSALPVPSTAFVAPPEDAFICSAAAALMERALAPW
ncbi:hypothetical protein DSECCO2_487660 [anaerobic digester metagenome]